MATHQEQEAIGTLQAVLNLYGADAYADIVAAFEDTSAARPFRSEAAAALLTEAFLDIIRQRQAPAIARFAGPFPSKDPID